MMGPLALLFLSSALADPCGLVFRPIEDLELTLERTGVQRTWVAWKDGVQTMVLRPGFSGDVADFGMLVPFPSPPELRKVDQQFFQGIRIHIV